MDTIDNYVPAIVRDLESPFLMPIDNAFTVPGRGTVVVGTIKHGIMRRNNEADLMGFGYNIKTTLSDIQIFKKSVTEVNKYIFTVIRLQLNIIFHLKIFSY